MKRFSRKSKKHAEKNSKDSPATISDGKGKQSSPSEEKSKSNLIKGWRKKLQRTPSIKQCAEPHIYGTAQSVVDMKSAPTSSSTKILEHNGSPENGYPYHRPSTLKTVENDDHDYSRVSNDEDEAWGGVSPRLQEENLAENRGNIYSSVTGHQASLTLPPRNLPSPHKETEPSCPNANDVPIPNTNNSNLQNNVLNVGDSNSLKVDAVQKRTPRSAKTGNIVSHPLTQEFHKLARKGWYWGPLSREQAENKLRNLPEASFLVRDSSDDRYLLSLSFRSNSRTLHTRIEHSGFKFSFYEDNPSQWYTSVIDLIENSIRDSNEQGVFCYSRSRQPNAPTFPVRLMHPVSRFTEVRPLQDLCRFVIRQYTRIDHIQNLPVPNQIKGYLNQSYF